MVVARRALGHKEKMPKALAPKEGQPRIASWGKLFEEIKYTRQDAIKEGTWRKDWLIRDYLLLIEKRKRAA